MVKTWEEAGEATVAVAVDVRLASLVLHMLLLGVIRVAAVAADASTKPWIL